MAAPDSNPRAVSSSRGQPRGVPATVPRLPCAFAILTATTARRGRTARGHARPTLTHVGTLEDEIDHGRLGWAYLGERAKEGSLDGLADALPAMLERVFEGVLGTPKRRCPEDARNETCGYLAPATGVEVYRRALSSVILPGFEEVGLNMGPTRERLAERGWG